MPHSYVALVTATVMITLVKMTTCEADEVSVKRFGVFTRQLFISIKAFMS